MMPYPNSKYRVTDNILLLRLVDLGLTIFEGSEARTSSGNVLCRAGIGSPLGVAAADFGHLEGCEYSASYC
jgi:hypothetical protein